MKFSIQNRDLNKPLLQNSGKLTVSGDIELNRNSRSPQWNKYADVYKRFSQSVVQPIFPISFYFTTCQSAFTIILILTISVHVLIIWTGVFRVSFHTNVTRMDAQLVEWVSNPYGLSNANTSSYIVPVMSGAFIWSMYVVFIYGLIITFWLIYLLIYITQYFQQLKTYCFSRKLSKIDVEKDEKENSFDFDYCFSFGLRAAILEACTSPETSQRLCEKHYHLTSAHQYYLQEVDQCFTFSDHARCAFYTIRKLFQFGDRKYTQSLGIGKILPLGKGAGKSGADFYSSHDGKLLLKALRKNEWRLLMNMLPAYISYCQRNPQTFLPRFYGCVTIEFSQIENSDNEPKSFVEKKKGIKKQQTNTTLLKNETDRFKGGKGNQFIIMNNVFSQQIKIHRKFDLKGSLQGRIAKKCDSDEVLKDKDFLSLAQYDNIINISRKSKGFVRKQLRHDVEFLRDQGIMDYSLLLGIHKVEKMNCICCKCPKFQKLNDASAPAVHGKGDTLYFIGIIDVLQMYNAKKKIENAVKGIPYKRSEISCVNPIQYSNRFIDFMKKNVFKE